MENYCQTSTFVMCYCLAVLLDDASETVKSMHGPTCTCPFFLLTPVIPCTPMSIKLWPWYFSLALLKRTKHKQGNFFVTCNFKFRFQTAQQIYTLNKCTPTQVVHVQLGTQCVLLVQLLYFQRGKTVNQKQDVRNRRQGTTFS